MTISARERTTAAEQEETSRTWRDWCSYLQTHLALLDRRAAQAGRTAFEADEAGEAAEETAQQTLRLLPAGQRVLFDHVVGERRQLIQSEQERSARMSGASRRQIDPDSVLRATLVALLDDAEGRTTGNGWGMVPLGTPDAITWFQVDVAALNDAPSAALYALGASRAADRTRRLTQFGILVGGALALLIVILLWPQAPTRPRQAGPVAPAILNSQALDTIWTPRTLTLRRAAETLATLPISATERLSWPVSTPTGQPAQARWWSAQPLPLVLCVPGALLTDATTAQIASAAGAPTRHYALRATPEGAGDLRLEACAPTANASAVAVRYGVLQETRTPPDATVGQAQSLLPDERTLTLTHVALVGAGDDPTLPSGQSRVLVRVAVDGGLPVDWPALAPTLLLASGEALLPGATTATATTTTTNVELAYLIPTPIEAGEAVWHVTPPGDDAPLRWRVTLAPPRSRDQVLRAQLTVEDVQLTSADGLLQIAIRVANRGETPLQLSPADLVLTQEEQPLPIPAIPELAQPISPGEQRSFSLAIPRERGRRVRYTLTIGAAPFQLLVPPE